MADNDNGTTTTRKPREKMILRKVRLPRAHADALDRLAELDDRTFNWLVRCAVADYLEGNENRRKILEAAAK